MYTYIVYTEEHQQPVQYMIVGTAAAFHAFIHGSTQAGAGLRREHN